jgi:hypothetical protein
MRGFSATFEKFYSDFPCGFGKLSVSRGMVSTSTHEPKPMCRTEEKMAETYKGDAYCVKCKEKRDFEGTVKVSDSGRRMAQGICPVCGTKVNRILGKA